MGQHNLQSDLEYAHMKVAGRSHNVTGVGFLHGWGTTLGAYKVGDTTARQGWACGADFRVTGGSAGQQVFINEGSITSSDWQRVETAGPPAEAGGTGLSLIDDETLEFGSAGDVIITWDSADLTIKPVTAETGRIMVGRMPMYLGTQANVIATTTAGAVTLSSTLTGVLRCYADDGGASIATSCRNILGRTLLTVDQTGGSIRSIMGQLKMLTGVDLTSGIYTAVQGYLELVGTHSAKTGSTFSCIDASMEITTALTVDSGGEACGIHVETTGAGTITNNGTCSAILITAASGAAAWPAGITIPNGAVVSQAIVLGSFGTPISYTGNELVEIHGRQTSATDYKPCMRVRTSSTSGTAMTTGTLVALQAQAYNTGTDNCAAIEAFEAHVGIKANATVIADIGTLPNMRAGWFKIEDLGNDLTLTGEAAVLVLGMQWNSGTTLTGNCDWISVIKEGSLTDPADAFIRVYDGSGGGWATHFLDIPESAPWSATNASSDGGKLKVKIGANTRYINLYQS